MQTGPALGSKPAWMKDSTRRGFALAARQAHVPVRFRAVVGPCRSRPGSTGAGQRRQEQVSHAGLEAASQQETAPASAAHGTPTHSRSLILHRFASPVAAFGWSSYDTDMNENGRQYRVAVIGATGAVGKVFLDIMEKRPFPLKELKLLASARSAGSTIRFRGEDLTVRETTPAEI